MMMREIVKLQDVEITFKMWKFTVMRKIPSTLVLLKQLQKKWHLVALSRKTTLLWRMVLLKVQLCSPFMRSNGGFLGWCLLQLLWIGFSLIYFSYLGISSSSLNKCSCLASQFDYVQLIMFLLVQSSQVAVSPSVSYQIEWLAYLVLSFLFSKLHQHL